jgi:signal transduction histidine kinase
VTGQRDAVLADITRSITSALDLDTVLLRIVDGAQSLCASDTAAIFLRDDVTTDMVPRYRVGPWLEAYKTLRIRPGEGIGGRVIVSGRPMRTERYLDDVHVPEHFHGIARETGTVTLMVVPITIASVVEGLLYISNRVARPFSDDDEAISMRLADQAAIAIQNARLFRSERAARTEAEVLAALANDLNATLDVTRVLPRVADATRELCAADLVRIALREPGSDAMVYRYLVGTRVPDYERLRLTAGPGFVGRVMQTGRPYRAAKAADDPAVHPEYRALIEAEGVLTAMVVPIATERGLEGVIYVARRTPAPFTDQDERICTRLADHAAIALRNAELLAREQAARTAAESANRAKDEFLAVLSHELRTPLTAILGWTRMLRIARLDDAKTERALESIERNARLQAQLIEDLLDVSRIVSGKLELDSRPVDVAPIVEAAVETARPAAEDKGLTIRADLDPTAGAVRGDAARLQQVAWNLLSNAIKFTPSGGAVHVSLARRNDGVHLVVADTGEGIGSDILPFIFDRFRQADGSSRRGHGGLGLGLAIARQIAALHGGTITAASPGPGQGTTLTVTLPHLADPSPPALRTFAVASGADAASGRLTGLDGLRVLLVDDEADARDLLTAILERCGAVVHATASVAKALEEVRHRKPDVILADLGMPGQNGYDFIRRLRLLGEGFQQIPTVAITAYASADDRQRVLDAGFQMHLAKPVEPLELARTVAHVCGRAPSS